MASQQTRLEATLTPLNTALGEIPSILDGENELQHAWKTVNWVYDLQKHVQELPLGAPFSNCLRKNVPRQTAGLLLVGLHLLSEAAQQKVKELNTNADSSAPITEPRAKDWALIWVEVDRRRLYISEKQPHIIASLRSYRKPPAVSMLAATCEQAMEDLRTERAVGGCKTVETQKIWLRECMDWWRLLMIAIERIPGADAVSETKRCQKSIELLEKYIALTKGQKPTATSDKTMET